MEFMGQTFEGIQNCVNVFRNPLWRSQFPPFFVTPSPLPYPNYDIKSRNNNLIGHLQFALPSIIPDGFRLRHQPVPAPNMGQLFPNSNVKISSPFSSLPKSPRFGLRKRCKQTPKSVKKIAPGKSNHAAQMKPDPQESAEDNTKFDHIKNDLGAYLCRLCQQEFTNAFNLAKHRCPRIRKIEYACPDCDKVFNCPANLASHRRWHKPRVRTSSPNTSIPPLPDQNYSTPPRYNCSAKPKSPKPLHPPKISTGTTFIENSSTCSTSPTTFSTSNSQNNSLDLSKPISTLSNKSPQTSPFSIASILAVKYVKNSNRERRRATHDIFPSRKSPNRTLNSSIFLGKDSTSTQNCEVCDVKGLTKESLEQHMLDHMMTKGLQAFIESSRVI